MESLPSGSDSGKWLECNGQAVDASAYPKLAALMSNVPDYQGVFLRGYGSQVYSQLNGSKNGITSTTYSSGILGETQGDSIRNISAYFEAIGNYWTYGGAIASVNLYGTGSEGGANHYRDSQFIFDTSVIVPTSNENRPINIAVRYLIKAK